MKRAHHGTPKRQSGISLVPEVWEALDRAASLAGVPRNQVMENILMRELGVGCDSHKTIDNSHELTLEPD